MISLHISDSTFSGANPDGMPVFDNLVEPTIFHMVGWYCIGPTYYGRPKWRHRLAWRLLGLKVDTRSGNTFIGGDPNAPAKPTGQPEFYVINGSRT